MKRRKLPVPELSSILLFDDDDANIRLARAWGIVAHHVAGESGLTDDDAQMGLAELSRITAAAHAREQLKCDKASCSRPATAVCACFAVNYCSAECQLEDWATHRGTCAKRVSPPQAEPEPTTATSAPLSTVAASRAASVQPWRPLPSAATPGTPLEQQQSAPIYDGHRPDLSVVEGSTSCPIFPLNLVLYPGGPLQLHIFERKYLKMLDACLRCEGLGNRVFGIMQGDTSAGTMCYIEEVVAQHGGRFLVTVRGLPQRFRLRSCVEHEDGYLCGDVVFFYDTDNSPAAISRALSLADQLRLQAEHTLKYMPATRRLMAKYSEMSRNSPSDLSFYLASALLFSNSNQDKQRLLEMTSVVDRLTALSALLPRSVPAHAPIASTMPTLSEIAANVVADPLNLSVLLQNKDILRDFPENLATMLLSSLAAKNALTGEVTRLFSECGVTAIKFVKSKSVTDDVINALADFPFIQHLTIDQCFLVTDESLNNFLGKHKNMITLDISRCKKITNSGIENIFFSAHTLTTFRLAGTRIHFHPHFSRLVNLIELDAEGTRFGDGSCTDLLKMPNLETLSIGSTDITDTGFMKISQVVSLRRLAACMNVRLTNAGISSVRDLVNLTSLNLSINANLSDEGIAPLVHAQNLIELNLERTEITDVSASVLLSLRRLQSLNVGRTLMGDRTIAILTGAIVETEGESEGALSELHTLLMHYTSVTDVGAALCSRFPALDTLKLTGCAAMTDAALLSFSPQLRFLDIGSQYITDRGVCGVVIGDRVPVGGLDHLTELRSLGLWHTSVSQKGATRIVECLGLCLDDRMVPAKGTWLFKRADIVDEAFEWAK
eukprot:TRINITY_DN3953_c0_g1_i1.p1 TRINITY_DN3953_c0_g1~~TRINITY_DN3953_c0_g1_i1.p1  ORF type:complete len:952 (-),score=215.63 TRINITY_DN3953_c0_g1_i1:30-2537(-)